MGSSRLKNKGDMTENVQDTHFKEFLVICVLITFILILGYYALSQKNLPQKESKASSEDLMATMLQTKGMIEAQSFCLVIKENGEIFTEDNQPCTSESALRALLSKVVDKTTRLRVEGNEKLDLQKLARIFEIARDVGFQEMKYQLVLFLQEEKGPIPTKKTVEDTGEEEGEEFR